MSEAVAANPFAGMLGVVPAVLPTVGHVTLVVQGLKLAKGRKLRKEEKARVFDGETPEEVAEQARELQALRRKVTNQAKHRRSANQPGVKERKRAWEAANKERRLAQIKAWEARNKERRRAYKTAWARQAKLLRPELTEADRARSAAYQKRERARRREKRAAMTPEQRAAELEKRRAYRAANREHINARKRAWKAAKAAQKKAAAGGGA